MYPFFLAVLGSEYCSGYMDALGKWNTGFYCPNSDESSDVFCCGTEIHKYCCTKGNVRIKYEQRMQFGVHFQIPETMWVWEI